MYHLQESIRMNVAYDKEEDEEKEKKKSWCDKILKQLEDLHKKADLEIKKELGNVTKIIADKAYQYLHDKRNKAEICKWAGRYPAEGDWSDIRENAESAIRGFIKSTILSFIKQHKDQIHRIEVLHQANNEKMLEKLKMFRTIFTHQEIKQEEEKLAHPKEEPFDVMLYLLFPIVLVWYAVDKLHDKYLAVKNKPNIQEFLDKWTDDVLRKDVSLGFVEKEVYERISPPFLEVLRGIQNHIKSYRVRVQNLDSRGKTLATRQAFGEMKTLSIALHQRLQQLPTV